MKSAGIIITLLLTAGISLTLLLPNYGKDTEMQDSDSITPDALVSPNDILMSGILSKTEDRSSVKYGVQISMSNTIAGVLIIREKLQNTEHSLILKPHVFLVRDTDFPREWYILALGPIKGIDEAQDIKYQLEQLDFVTQLILWPTVKTDKKSST